MKVTCPQQVSARWYRCLLKGMYETDRFFRDSTINLFALVTKPKGAFSSRVDSIPVIISNENGEVLAFALLIHAQQLADTLQIAFFEVRPGCQDAAGQLVKTACDKARRCGAKRIIAGMNGHVNYGLGFLSGPFDQVSCFGSAYNPPHYPEMFRALGFSETRLVSYRYDVTKLSMAKEAAMLRRLQRRFTFRKADFRRLKTEIRYYTDLNNRTFADHPFYFPRHADEDYELFHPFRWFLKEENLLIAEADGRPVAFLLWYPDFNELIGPGKPLGITALARYRLFGQRIKKLKIAEIGVVPEFQCSGVMLGLFDLCYQLVSKRFEVCESGWVLETNQKSKNICRRWQPTLSNSYAVFSREV